MLFLYSSISMSLAFFIFSGIYSQPSSSWIKVMFLFVDLGFFQKIFYENKFQLQEQQPVRIWWRIGHQSLTSFCMLLFLITVYSKYKAAHPVISFTKWLFTFHRQLERGSRTWRLLELYFVLRMVIEVYYAIRSGDTAVFQIAMKYFVPPFAGLRKLNSISLFGTSTSISVWELWSVWNVLHQRRLHCCWPQWPFNWHLVYLLLINKQGFALQQTASWSLIMISRSLLHHHHFLVWGISWPHLLEYITPAWQTFVVLRRDLLAIVVFF